MFFSLSLSINMIFCRRDVSCSSQRKRRWDLIITAGERIYFDECEWGNIWGNCNKKMRKILCFISDLNLSDGEGGIRNEGGRWKGALRENECVGNSEVIVGAFEEPSGSYKRTGQRADKGRAVCHMHRWRKSHLAKQREWETRVREEDGRKPTLQGTGDISWPRRHQRRRDCGRRKHKPGL